MIPHKDDPLRPPDWRWLRARWLRENGKYVRKRLDDQETKVIRDYQNAKAKCHSELDLYRLSLRYPGLSLAERLKQRTDRDGRYILESRVLALEHVEEIADKMRLPVDGVLWYEKTFFDVRPFVKHHDYVVDVVFPRSIHKGLYERDYDLLWKIIGWKLGSHALDSIISRTTNLSHVLSADQVDAAWASMIRSNYNHKAVMASFTTPISYNQNAIMEIWNRMLEIEKSAGAGTDTANLIVNNISAALTNLPFTTDRDKVAGPALTYYDEQSAELRADEMLRLTIEGDSPQFREAVGMGLPEAKDGNDAKDQQGN